MKLSIRAILYKTMVYFPNDVVLSGSFQLGMGMVIVVRRNEDLSYCLGTVERLGHEESLNKVLKQTEEFLNKYDSNPGKYRKENIERAK